MFKNVTCPAILPPCSLLSSHHRKPQLGNLFSNPQKTLVPRPPTLTWMLVSAASFGKTFHTTTHYMHSCILHEGLHPCFFSTWLLQTFFSAHQLLCWKGSEKAIPEQPLQPLTLYLFPWISNALLLPSKCFLHSSWHFFLNSTIRSALTRSVSLLLRQTVSDQVIHPPTHQHWFHS